MRELKFRAWDGEKIHDNIVLQYDWTIQPNVVEQYTGLKDKNGKKIYEGDIVRYEDAIFTIGWNDDHARFGFKPIKGCDISMSFSMKECEVIGNIHENKELLENE